MLLALRSTDFLFQQSSGMLFLGDVLLEIDGVKVSGKPVREIAHQLLGPPGSPVEIALQVRLPNFWVHTIRPGMDILLMYFSTSPWCLCGFADSIDR